MAKAKDTLATLEQFTVGGNLDVSDVLSVVTSRAEDKYATEFQRCRDEIAANETANTQLATQIGKQAKKEAMAKAAPHQKACQTALKPLGGKASAAFQKDGGRTRVLPVNEDGMLVVTIAISRTGEHGGYHSSANFSVETKPSKDLQKLVKEHEATKDSIKVLQTEALGWKRQLHNVPMLERQYRAKIAEAKLETSEDGRRLIELLTDGLDDAIMNLPAC